MRNILSIVFSVSLMIAIFLGVLMVISQAVGLIIHSNEWLLGSKAYFAKTAFIASGIAGMAAFIVSYLPKVNH